MVTIVARLKVLLVGHSVFGIGGGAKTRRWS